MTDPEFFKFLPEGLRPAYFFIKVYRGRYIEGYIEKYIENWKTVDNLWITFNWDRTIVGVVGVSVGVFSLSRQFWGYARWLAAVTLVYRVSGV